MTKDYELNILNQMIEHEKDCYDLFKHVICLIKEQLKGGNDCLVFKLDEGLNPNVLHSLILNLKIYNFKISQVWVDEILIAWNTISSVPITLSEFNKE